MGYWLIDSYGKQSRASFYKIVKGLLLLSLIYLFPQTLFSQNDGRLHILNSDILYRNYIDPHADVLVGNVKLSRDGAYLDCDSAKYYKEEGSFDAFGNVKYHQGDTLSMVCDTLLYDGISRQMKARGSVVLKRRQSKLVTEKLDYDRVYGVGMYMDGGTLYDGDNVLVSDWGQYTEETQLAFFTSNVKLTNNGTDVLSDSLEYNTRTKDAFFTGNVKLKNDDYDIVSTAMYYNTDTEKARIIAPTNITTSDGMFIYSTNGDYDMKEDNADLLTGSYIIKDMRKIEGDSLHYDKASGINEAFRNVIVTDEENQCMLLGDYCWYDENTGNALATDSAVVIDYSSPDTMYVHADTLKMFTYNIETDSVYRDLYAFHHVRMFRSDVQAVCDSMVTHELDSCTYLYGQPILWNENEQVFGEEIRVYNNDSTISWIRVINQAMTVERLDSMSYNQVSAKEIRTYFNGKEIDRNEAHGNVLVCYYFSEDDGTPVGMNYSESTDLTLFLKDKKVSKIWMPAANGNMYPPDKIPSDKRFLKNFAWFDYIRPIDKYDIFNWRSKEAKDILSQTSEKQVPLQSLSDIKEKAKNQQTK